MTQRSNRTLRDSTRRWSAGLLTLLSCVVGGCDSPTGVNAPAPPALSGTFLLFAMDGFPTNWICTAWVDPGVGAAIDDTDGYFFMYVNATLTFRPAAGEVEIKHRLVSCGGEPETIDVDLLGSFEQRGSLILLTHSAGAKTYTDTARLRGDTLIVRALRIRRGLEPRGTAVMSYWRDR